MNWLDKLERKYGKYAIHNLMLYVVIGYVVGFALVHLRIISYFDLILFPPLVTQAGEYWRLVTFLFYPPTTSIIFFAFVLYFYYLIGRSLEMNWGTLKFNLYYFLGVTGTILASFITGMPMTTYYINLTMFLAFARLFPEFQVNLYFILPVKIKYLAWIQWGYFAFVLVTGNNADRGMLVVAILNYLLFFGGEVVKGQKAHNRKQQYKRNVQVKKAHFHRCTVCGRTEEDNPNLEFRYCSKCNGTYEYCSEHLFSHEHKS